MVFGVHKDMSYSYGKGKDKKMKSMDQPYGSGRYEETTHRTRALKIQDISQVGPLKTLPIFDIFYEPYTILYEP